MFSASASSLYQYSCKAPFTFGSDASRRSPVVLQPPATRSFPSALAARWKTRQTEGPLFATKSDMAILSLAAPCNPNAHAPSCRHASNGDNRYCEQLDLWRIDSSSLLGRRTANEVAVAAARRRFRCWQVHASLNKESLAMIAFRAGDESMILTMIIIAATGLFADVG